MLGALALQHARGLANDVFCQIGLVMLVGLASKNAILIVEFAEQLRRQGRSPVDAVIEAATIRLRPILMTSIAFLLGVMPLMLATGAGAAARNSLGTAVFGGMAVSTAINLIFIPGLYVLFQRRGGAPAGALPMMAPAAAATTLGPASTTTLATSDDDDVTSVATLPPPPDDSAPPHAP